jgi:Flp pilus assembly protein TadD/SAM-dependent methyltransferase
VNQSSTADAFMAAVRHHQSGQFAEADRLYRTVIAAEPHHMHALHLCGALAHAAGRNDEAVKLIGRAIALDGQVPEFHYNIGLALWALNRRREASDHWMRAIAIKPNFAEARMNLGNALREEGRFVEAIAQHRAALQLQQSPPVHNSLGLTLAKSGRDEEAIPHYQRAIALRPDFIDAYLNLAMSYWMRGQAGDAVAVTMRSIDIRETPENKELFTRLVFGLAIERDDANLRRFLTRALMEGWSAPTVIAPAAMGLVRLGPAASLIVRAAQAWPARLPAEQFGSPGLAALNDPLLQALMGSTVLTNADLEKFLAACRFALLEIVEATPAEDADEALLGIASILARQCFINEYVYAADDDEEKRAWELRNRLKAVLTSGGRVSPLWIAAVAAYFPLYQLFATNTLLEWSWPLAIAALLDQQVRAPQQEKALGTSIRQLTPIEGDVSEAVQTQYEANPYPRWITAGTPRKFTDINAFIRELFPVATYSPLAKAAPLDILIAGCGTGQHAILTAQEHVGARTLAIDLSRSSLGYAASKTRALGLENIEYAQADIMRLGSLERRFDLIESVGVLHHLADPYAGWRVLLSLLRPGGLMRIGLYSETARWGVVAARKQIAEKGYGSTPAEIRRFRKELMRRDDDTARNIVRFNDFYSMSECRDLLFHTQEHRMTLPEIKGFLAEQGLHLLGLETPRVTARQYASRFPEDKAMTDLDQWHAFEQDNPHTFETMYRVWLQKPAS